MENKIELRTETRRPLYPFNVRTILSEKLEELDIRHEPELLKLWNAFAEEQGESKIFADVETYFDGSTFSPLEAALFMFYGNVENVLTPVMLNGRGGLESVYKLPDEKKFVDWVYKMGFYKERFVATYDEDYYAEGETVKGAIASLRALVVETFSEEHVEPIMAGVTVAVDDIEFIYSEI